MIALLKCPKCHTLWGCRETVFRVNKECSKCEEYGHSIVNGCSYIYNNYYTMSYLCEECLKKEYRYYGGKK